MVLSVCDLFPRRCVRWHRLRTRTLNTLRSPSSTSLSIGAKKTSMSSSLSVPSETPSAIVCASSPLSSTAAPSTGSRHGLMMLLVSCEEGWWEGGGCGGGEVHVGGLAQLMHTSTFISTHMPHTHSPHAPPHMHTPTLSTLSTCTSTHRACGQPISRGCPAE